MHLISRRNIVDWNDMHLSSLDDHTSRIACDSSPVAYATWMNVMFAISLIVNIVVGAVIWRVPMFRGVLWFVLRTAVLNTIRASTRFFLSQERVGRELSNEQGSETRIQEDRDLLENPQSSGFTVHYDAGSSCLNSLVDNPSPASCNAYLDSSNVQSIRMPVDLSSMDRVIIQTNDSLTVASERDQGHNHDIPG